MSVEDPLELMKSVDTLRSKAKQIDDLAVVIGRWVERLNALNLSRAQGLKPIQSVTLADGKTINIQTLGEPLNHSTDMITDAMTEICTLQIEAGYRRIQALKEEL